MESITRINKGNLNIDDIKNCQLSKVNKNKFLFFCSGLIILFLARDVINIPISTMIFVAYVGMIFLFSSVSECIAFALFMLPFSNGMKLTLPMGICLLFLLYKKRNTMKLGSSVFVVFFLLLYELFHSFILPFSFINYIQFLTNMILITVICLDRNANYDYLFIAKAFVAGVIASNAVLLIQTLKFYGYSMSLFLNAGIRYGNTRQFLNSDTFVFSNNQNLVAQYCLLSICILLILLFQSRKKRLILFNLAVLTLFGIFTASKTFILVFAFVIVYVAFYQIINNKKNVISGLKKFFAVIFIFFILIMIIGVIAPTSIDFITSRFIEEDLTSGRIGIFKMYNQAIFKDPLTTIFGVGIQYLSTKNGFTRFSPHNATQEIIYAWGLIGLFIIVAFVLSLISASKYQLGRKPKLIYYLTLFTFLIYSQSGQLFSINEIIMIFIPCFISMTLGKCKTKN